MTLNGGDVKAVRAYIRADGVHMDGHRKDWTHTSCYIWAGRHECYNMDIGGTYVLYMGVYT